MLKFNEWLASKGITKEAFAENTEKQAELYNEYNDLFRTKLNDLEANGATKTEIETLKSELSRVKDEQFEYLKSVLKKQGTELAKLKDSAGTSKRYSTLKEAITASLMAQKGEIDKAVAGNQTHAIKAVVDMQVDNTIGAGSTQVTITDNTGVISPYRRREMTYLAHVSVGRTSGNRALWIEQTAEDGTPIMLGEGDAKTQLSSLWQEKTADVKKIAVYGKVTTELMADIPQLVSYIQANLMKRLDIKLEDQYFTGNGVGDNLKGAETFATAFSAGALVGTVPNANAYDVIEAVATQCLLAHGMPNGIFVNPTTIAEMKLTKGTDGHYVMPVFATANGLEVAGMKVIPTSAVDAGDFIGGDLSVLNVLIRSELGIQIGLDGNDFTNNKKTMLVEKRVVQYASANDVACLIKGDFATAKLALLPA